MLTAKGHEDHEEGKGTKNCIWHASGVAKIARSFRTSLQIEFI